ncbi:MAG: tetratricopeptide repeat protein [Bryobacterales bacterium]|nr:tetratricopeptide repeat protein [Bryobacterales bacterium]
MMRGIPALALCFVVSLGAQPKREEPVGLMLQPGGAKLLRAGVETPLAAKAGDVLFAGDTLRTEAAAASFLFCPGKSSQSLAPSGEALLEATQIKVKSGQLAGAKPVASCFLPKVVRVATASQQHYGVSMTRGLGDEPEAKGTPADQLPAEVRAALAPIEEQLKADPKDQAALVARAAVFEQFELRADALLAYKQIGEQFPDAVWVKGKLFELGEAVADAAARAAAQAPTGGQTFALLVGVSKYQKLPQEQWLQFANNDATVFEKHLRSPRGGEVKAENLIRLTDEAATTAALRNAFQTFLKGRAGKNDTVVILMAGHGTVETPGSKGAYVLTYDSDPQDLSGTALPMEEIQNLVEEELSKVGRVALFVDVCRAGNIGTIRNTTVNRVVEQMGDIEGQMLGLMASRPRELSYEGPEFGGGHGAFSYFLLKALNGEADANGDNIVDANEIINYVQREVAKATNDKQHPREFGAMDNVIPFSDISKPGIELTRLRFPYIYISGTDEPALLAAQVQQGALASELGAALRRFDEALDAGRLLPDEPDSAFAALRDLESRLDRVGFHAQQNRLRVALEDRGQQVILRYLTGDEIPQTRDDFNQGTKWYEAARQLTPESLFLNARESFCSGRTLLFDKRFAEAQDLLEEAIRIDPNGAQGYNALGIAYLEQADFTQAIPAFRDAVRLAPHWAYPLHNLALAYTEVGDYQNAIRSYQEAIRLRPTYGYLPYNLGLIYQRLNRRRDAERSYRRAIALGPEKPEPYNALGSLKASTGKEREAETLYKQALEKSPSFLAARHNLALLLADQKGREQEAVALWRQNLAQDKSFLPSRLSLAEHLAATDPAGAAAEYRAVLAERPEYVAARLALARALEASGDAAAALAELNRAAAAEADNAVIPERIGDLERSRGRHAEAEAAYRRALDLAPDNAARRRISRKLRR